LASRTTANHPPRIRPHSVKASTAYSLQVGVKRHEGNRSGDTIVRYSWMTKMTLLAALPFTTRLRP
jgi:uncharacterized lipoprotein YmbA